MLVIIKPAILLGGLIFRMKTFHHYKLAIVLLAVAVFVALALVMTPSIQAGQNGIEAQEQSVQP